MGQIEYFGEGSINYLEEIVNKHDPKKMFLVTGKRSFISSGAKDKISAILKDRDYCIFNDFSSNPKLTDISVGLDIYKKNDCDLTIAIGGGSAIDIAKSINIFSNNDKEPYDYITKKERLDKKGNTMVAIPTTSGTGSEATHFAVVYIDKQKYSLADECMLPDYSIIDPSLTHSLGKRLTACTGMDALSQAIESYWSVNSTDESKRYAKEAITLIMDNIESSVNRPDRENRKNMSLGSNLAGKAINISKTTAPHAISYPITSYFGVPHGHAVGLTLPYILEYNNGVDEGDTLDRRGKEYVKDTTEDISRFIGSKDVISAKDKLIQMMKDIGLETRLSELGMNEKDIGLIIENGFNPERVKNNPRKINKEELQRILKDIL